MRKLIYGLGILVLMSISFSLGTLSVPVGAFSKAVKTDGVTGRSEPFEAAVTISPTEITRQVGGNLPVAQWSDPF